MHLPDNMGWNPSLMDFLNGFPSVSKLVSSVAIETHSLIQGQTYEGGIAGSPGTEAHGAYAFCALGCLCILGDPRDMLSK